MLERDRRLILSRVSSQCGILLSSFLERGATVGHLPPHRRSDGPGAECAGGRSGWPLALMGRADRAGRADRRAQPGPSARSRGRSGYPQRRGRRRLHAGPVHPAQGRPDAESPSAGRRPRCKVPTVIATCQEVTAVADLIEAILQAKGESALERELSPEQELAVLARMLHAEGYDDHIFGHLSIRQPDGSLLVNPSNLGWRQVTASDVVRLAPDGTHLAGRRVAPAAIELHLALHRLRDDVD